MAVPKRKQTPSRTGIRRAQNMKFSSKNIVEDKKSGEYRLSQLWLAAFALVKALHRDHEA